MATSIALSVDTHHWLKRYKERAGLSSLDEAVALLLHGGAESAQQLMARRHVAVKTACRRHGIGTLTAFGSRVWGSSHPQSDLDLIATFNRPVSLFDILDIQEDLSAAFGVPVDLHTWEGLRPRVRQRAKERGVRLLG